MATKKSDSELTKAVVDAVAEEAKPVATAKVFKERKQPAEFVNSSFAERAKANGKNKRVDSSDSK